MRRMFIENNSETGPCNRRTLCVQRNEIGHAVTRIFFPTEISMDVEWFLSYHVHAYRKFGQGCRTYLVDPRYNQSVYQWIYQISICESIGFDIFVRILAELIWNFLQVVQYTANVFCRENVFDHAGLHGSIYFDYKSKTKKAAGRGLL